MRPLAAALAPLVASLLLIAAVIAPAHCLLRPPAGETGLCLPGGGLGPPADPGEAHHVAGACPVAAAIAQLLPAPPVPVPAPPPRIEPVAYAAIIPPAHPAPAHRGPRARAPPAA